MGFHENMRYMEPLPLDPVGDVLVIVDDNQTSVWIYGHPHNSTDMTIDNTTSTAIPTATRYSAKTPPPMIPL